MASRLYSCAAEFEWRGYLAWRLQYLLPWPEHTWHVWEVNAADGPQNNIFHELICMEKGEGKTRIEETSVSALGFGSSTSTWIQSGLSPVKRRL